MRAVAVSPNAPPKWKAYMARRQGRVRAFQGGGPNDPQDQPDQDVTGSAGQPMTLDDYYSMRDQTGAAAPQPSAPQTEPATTGQPMTLDDLNAMRSTAAPTPDVSASGAVAIGAARAAAPAVGSVAAMLAGAKAGAVLGAGAGALTGPFAEVASPVLGTLGGFAGGVAGAMGGGYILNKAQDWVLDKLGLLPKVEAATQAAKEQHPYAEFAGELLPSALSFKFGDAPKLVRAFYGLGAAGLEAGQEYAQEGKVDPFKVGASGLVGAALTEPARAGAYSEKLVGKAFGSAGNFVDRFRSTAPADVQDRADAKTITPTDNAQGAAPVQPPPVETDVKPTETGGASTGSEREYPKDERSTAESGGTPTAPPVTTQGDVKPDVAAAIKAKADPNAYTQQKQAEAEYWSKPPTDVTYPHGDPDMKGVTISRERDVPGNVTSDPNDPNKIYVDRNLPPTVDVNGKPIDPAYPLAIREAGRRVYTDAIAERSAKLGRDIPPNADVVAQQGADLSEKAYLESRGYDHDAFKQAIGEAAPPAPAAAPAAPAPEPAAAAAPPPEATGAPPAPAAPAPEPVAQAPPQLGAPPETAPARAPQAAPEPPAPAPAPPETTGSVPPDDIPGFLRRGPGATEEPPPPPAAPPRPQVQDPAFAQYLERRAAGAAKDAAARAELEAQQSASKRAKSTARIGKMKAAQAGETTAMPLQGRAALDAIRQRGDPGITGSAAAPEAKARTKPAERVEERAKIENGTAVDNPNWLSQAASGFIRDTGGSVNYQQFLKTFTTLGGAYGNLQARHPWLPELKPPDTTFRVRKARTEAEGYSRAISDQLYKNGQMKVNEENAVEQNMKAMPADDKKIMADEDAEKQIYRARETNKLNSLPDRLRAFYDKHVKPYFDKQASDYSEIKELTKGDEWAEDRDELLDATNPNYVHRMAVGHTEPTDTITSGASADPVEGRARGVRAKTTPLEARKFLAMEDADGNRRVISPNKEGFAVWKDRKPEQVNYDGKTGHGSEVEYDGKKWTVGQATTEEIKQHGMFANGQPADYYENGMYSAVNGMLKTQEALRNIKLLQDLKSHPKWNDYTADLRTEEGKKRAEENGWKESSMPQMKGIAMADDIRHAFDEYSRPGIDSSVTDRLRAVSQAVTKTLFFTPVPHALNAFWHWWVGRGWDWMNPNEYKKLIPELMQAYKSVMTQDAFQDRIRAVGGGTVEGGIWMQGFQRRLAEAVGIDAKRNPAKWEALAEMMGMGRGAAAVTDLVRSIYNWSSNTMWTINDILHTHQTMVNMRKGMSLEDAVRHTEIHIPNYRMPMTVLGSRVLAQVLGEPTAVAFGRYHAGVYQSLAHMTKSLAFGNAAERNEAAGNVFALGLFALVMKPLLLDPMVQYLTGDDEAEMSPRGPLAPLHTWANIIDNKQGYEAAMGEAVSYSPWLNFLNELHGNRDFAGHRIVTPGSAPLQKAGQIADLVARGFVAPYGTIANAQNRFEDSGPLMKAAKAIGAQALDVKVGRAPGADFKAEKAIRREAGGREKRAQGPFEALANWLSE